MQRMLRFYRNWLRVCAALAVLGGLLLAPPGPVWACSCAQPRSPAVAAGDAVAVFSGAVTSIVDRGSLNLPDVVRSWLGQPHQTLGGDSRRVTLAVANSWKGVTETPVTIGTGNGNADCGFSFNVGGQYLVYAYDNQGQLVTNMCLRTAALSQASVDLTYLQTLPMLTVTPAAPNRLLGVCLAGAAGLVGLLALAGGAGWLWRRRARANRPA